MMPEQLDASTRIPLSALSSVFRRCRASTLFSCGSAGLMGGLVRLCRWLRGASAVCLAVALIPSACFLANLDRGVSGERTTDGIVALSGEPQRFAAAMTLLAGQRAQRLLLVGLDN